MRTITVSALFPSDKTEWSQILPDRACVLGEELPDGREKVRCGGGVPP
jgi:hypothetical protein